MPLDVHIPKAHASASESTISTDAASTNTDADYATVEFSDPWDFSNVEDFPSWGAQNVVSYNVANGVLDANVN